MRILLVALLSVSFATAAHAQAKKSAPKQKRESVHDQFSGQGYGLAGCGLGSIVFGAKPGLIQVVAATLNGTAGSQTFGITSGTSNCNMPEMSMAAASFIEVNREVVAKDAARGNGESLNNLASIFKCSNFELFGNKMKASYDKVFNPENDSFAASRTITETIQNDAELAQVCAPLT